MKMKFLMLFVLFCISYSAVVSGVAISANEKSDKPTIRKIMTVNEKKVINKKVKFGDEVLTADQLNKYQPLEKGHWRKKRAVLKRDTATLWPNGRVPYEINNSYSQGGTLNDAAKNTIRLAMNKIEEISCIKFVPKQDSDKDFLRIISDAGCWSYVGRTGGSQEVSIDADGCVWEDIIIHELLHALGFYHEQSRPDRDDHIEIIWDNIDKKMQHNFEKRKDTDSLGVTYDIKSIMHYDNYAFSNNKKMTMRIKGGGNTELGGSKLAASDIKQLNMLYQCTTTKPGGTTAKPISRTTTTFPVSTASPPTTSPTTTTEKIVLQCMDNVDYCDIIDTYHDCKLDFFQQNCMKTCKKCNTDKVETTVGTTTTRAKTTSSTSTRKPKTTTSKPVVTSTILTTTHSTKCTNEAEFCEIFGTEFCYDEVYADSCHKTCTACDVVTNTPETTEHPNPTEACKDEDSICPYIDHETCQLRIVQSMCKKTCSNCGETNTVIG